MYEKGPKSSFYFNRLDVLETGNQGLKKAPSPALNTD